MKKSSDPKTLADLPAPDAETTRSVLGKLRLQEYVARVVAEAPALGVEQRARLVGLLNAPAETSLSGARPNVTVKISDPLAVEIEL